MARSILLLLRLICCPLALAPAQVAAVPPSFADVVDRVQPKMVKIYGAGGLKKLEAYQSGFLVSPEGHVLTVWSYVLDSDVITVTLNDGRKYEAQFIGADPRLQIAVLKIDAEELPCFEMQPATPADAGTRVLAFSNLFGVATGNEPTSVMRGVIAVRAPLAARSGAYRTPYRGEVYVVDAITNNPGAAGGALTDRNGKLLGILGKELRNALNNTWLNYAIPLSALTASVADIRAGKQLPRDVEQRDKPDRALELAALGIVLVPDVLNRTPPFVDLVRRGSVAAMSGIQPDDLVIFINDHLVQSCKALHEELSYIQDDASIKLTVLREQELLEFMLKAKSGAN